MRIDIADTEAMEAFGRELGAVLRAGDVVVLAGSLGAGKTTLTRGIGEGLGIRGPVQSPTFVLARTHPSVVGGPPLVHVDAYRLGSEAELWDLDLDFDGSVVVVEWGAGLLDELDDRLDVVIDRPESDRPAGAADGAAAADPDAELDVDELRVLHVAGVGPRWAGTPFAAE